MATLEDATRCPKCSETGFQKTSAPGKRGSTLRTYICMNERCTWYNTGWLVQIAADGTIPERAQGPKDFIQLTPGQEAMARRVIEDAIQADLRDSE